MSSGSRHSIGLRNICGLEDSDISATTRRRRADTLPNHASGNQCEAEALSSSSTMQGSLNAELVNSQELPFPDASLGRHGTLLSHNATPVRRTAELRSLLGNANSRLRSRAIISQHSQGRGTTSLEQAKPRARVEIDIVLHNNVCIEGGYMKGQIKLRIRPRSKKESAVKISDGKLRLIGFESIEGDHHEFFQVSAPLSTVTNSAHIMYDSPPDEEGFYAAREGVHKLDFEMHIPMNSDKRPKGPLHGQSGGIAIRYIALASIKVKDDVHCRSIAHFYRDCEVWPRLNPSVVLAPAEHPIQAAAAKSLFMGGSGNVKLTASLHRSIFIAGQQCPINVAVQNDSKRVIKSLTLTLFRTTVVFKPQLAASHDTAMPDLDACQTCTTRKQVAISTLEMAQGFPRGHASANGWWAGIPSGERSSFSHLLLIPPDALTHSRKRLLEVQYSIRVSVHAGSLTTDVYVTLPIQVVNFLSLDPPPSYPLLHSQEEMLTPPSTRTQVDVSQAEDEYRDASEYSYDPDSDPSADEGFQDDSITYDTEEELPEAELGNLPMCEDAEDLVQHAIISAQTRCPETIDEGLDQLESEHPQEGLTDSEASSPTKTCASRPNRPRGPSSFAMRVQEKLQVAANAREPFNPDHSRLLEPIQDDDGVEGLTGVALHIPQMSSKSDNSSDSGYHSVPSSFLNDHYRRPPRSTLSASLRAEGSRLPRPLSIVGLPFPETNSDLSGAPLLAPEVSSPGIPAAAGNQTIRESNASDARSSATPKRPPITSGATGGSASSVKDRIKELEERVRIAHAMDVEWAESQGRR